MLRVSVYRGGKICEKSKPTANSDEEHGQDSELGTYGVANDVVGWKSLEPNTDDHTP